MRGLQRFQGPGRFNFRRRHQRERLISGLARKTNKTNVSMHNKMEELRSHNTMLRRLMPFCLEHS
jgi:hypothetical protein